MSSHQVEAHALEPILGVAATPTITPSITVAPSPALPQASVQVEQDSEKSELLKKAKERFPDVPESELMNLIDKGVNIENIERPRQRVDIDVTQLIVAIRQYKERYGTFPSGSSLQIGRALTGENKDRAIFIEWPNNSRTSTGELLDQWGKPYEIKIENNIIAVRSAGPDGLFETEDDTVLAK